MLASATGGLERGLACGVKTMTGAQVTRLKVILLARLCLLVDSILFVADKVLQMQDLAELILKSGQEAARVTQTRLLLAVLGAIVLA